MTADGVMHAGIDSERKNNNNLYVIIHSVTKNTV